MHYSTGFVNRLYALSAVAATASFLPDLRQPFVRRRPGPTGRAKATGPAVDGKVSVGSKRRDAFVLSDCVVTAIVRRFMSIATNISELDFSVFYRLLIPVQNGLQLNRDESEALIVGTTNPLRETVSIVSYVRDRRRR